MCRHQLLAYRGIEDHCREAVDGCQCATVVVAVAEPRDYLVAYDAAGDYVGDHPFKTVTGAYLHGAVVARYEQQQAVVLVALSYTPFLK